jgi:hypothetical protein
MFKGILSLSANFLYVVGPGWGSWKHSFKLDLSFLYAQKWTLTKIPGTSLAFKTFYPEQNMALKNGYPQQNVAFKNCFLEQNMAIKAGYYD